ncbi:SDR family NAD(P)-dependent oxidoreductase [Paracraurococcus ruber]|uniref:SDR family oxidoreductase n=1 Tax=Paracraurococcus ruber TaxID=77675 RepID=A0ABS1CR63_9PROT|nr:SDR family NAD(P)-dependent oxidoreductase [Paracraurococcus ruber]MBK1656782.1 SDR family oxidoreductase [Paracraurococcus ruber]TDG33611.1 SDR family NAD(P)-dependent oxidoreductase [Paracraurococcus ruber]
MPASHAAPPGAGTALVTGASAGIGAAYAERLARRGHNLILVARSAGRLEDVAATLRAQTGRGVEVLAADLAQEAGLALVEARLRADPHIALLVNNAGMALAGPVAGADPARLAAMVQLNVVAAARLAAAAATAFRARGQGTLVNIASVLGLAPERFNAVYAASKAFMLALSQGLDAELRGSGVRVQAVLPGATRTAIWAAAGLDLASIPADMVMEVKEMVDAALAGLDAGELVTLPSLPDAAGWERLDRARLALGPHLSRRHAAERYARGGQPAEAGA